MIIYQAPKVSFLGDLEESRIDQLLVDGFRERLGRGVSPSEVGSWRNSLQYVGNVLRDPLLPDDLGVSVECQIPRSSKRIDVILTGQGGGGSDHAVIVELKQWERAERTAKDGIVLTFLGGSKRETVHPSYQAWGYATLLEQFNETVQTDGIVLHPCAFLHNCAEPAGLTDRFYSEYLSRAPLFIRNEVGKLRGFIREFITLGDRTNIMGRIEQSRLRPSRKLSDAVLGMLDQRPEFVLVDEQKEVLEMALQLARQPTGAKKQVLIVHGGPGTGKSVVAINLVARLTGEGRFAQYVSKNSAPRAVYSERLAGSRRKREIDGLFCGSGSYIGIESDSCECLIVDEAHRLNEKSGLYGNKGENQIKEVICAARCSVFFIDEDQRVTLKDIGTTDTIKGWAARLDANVTVMRLESQFRCQGSDAYRSWERSLNLITEAEPGAPWLAVSVALITLKPPSPGSPRAVGWTSARRSTGRTRRRRFWHGMRARDRPRVGGRGLRERFDQRRMGLPRWTGHRAGQGGPRRCEGRWPSPIGPATRRDGPRSRNGPLRCRGRQRRRTSPVGGRTPANDRRDTIPQTGPGPAAGAPAATSPAVPSIPGAVPTGP